MSNETINISINDLTRMLISECRYGYTRNNHLMPSCAYNDSLKAIKAIAEEDLEASLRCSKKLCEECISDELANRFFDGLEDDCGNLNDSLDFVEDLLEHIHKTEMEWKPYNYDTYLSIKDKILNNKYDLYEVDDFDVELTNLKEKGKLVKGALTYNETLNKIFEGFEDTLFYNKRDFTVANKIVGSVIKFEVAGTNQKKLFAYCVNTL